MKKSLGPNTYIFPLPSVVVNVYDEEGKANMMTASWTGVVNSSPPMISVSLREATYSHDLIVKKKAFTVSIPSRKHLTQMDFVGTLSGRNIDKFNLSKLTPIGSDLVDAPYVEEFPVTLECQLVKYEKLGLHTMFIGQILDVKVDESCINASGMPDMKKIDPIAYAHGDRSYFGIGNYLGPANRMWQSTNLNKAFDNQDKKDILNLVNDYFDKLDRSAELEDFDSLINWQTFEMTNGDLRLDNRSKYAKWYEEVVHSMFNRKHIIEKMTISSIGQIYKVEMQVYFSADKWTPGQACSQKLEVKGHVEWLVSKSEAGQMQIDKYLIRENS